MHTPPSALAVLKDAFDRCRHEDMRTADVATALEFLSPRADPQWPLDQFRKGLDCDNEKGR